MPEENIEGLNEQVEETVDDASVITVPIDTSLTHSGEAADARAVGVALAGKADRSEVQSNITVDGQSKDMDGNITVLAEHIPYADSGSETVKSKLDALASATGETIPMTDGENPQSIADAIDAIGSKSADQIPMASGVVETVAGRLATVQENISDNGLAIGDLQRDLGAEYTDAQVRQMVLDVFQGGE